jgi:hypothetical protein
MQNQQISLKTGKFVLDNLAYLHKIEQFLLSGYTDDMIPLFMSMRGAGGLCHRPGKNAQGSALSQ